jgi:hypothetical protein
VGHALISDSLFHLEVSHTRVFQSDLKTDGDEMTVVQVASSRRLRRVKVEDERIDAMVCLPLLLASLCIPRLGLVCHE